MSIADSAKAGARLPDSSAASDAAGRIAQRLRAAQARVIRQRILASLCLTATAALVLLTGAALLDYFLELAWGIRAAWLALAAVTVGAGLFALLRLARRYRL